MIHTAQRGNSTPATTAARVARNAGAWAILPCAIAATLLLASCATKPEVVEAPPPEPVAPVAVVVKDHSSQLHAAHQSYTQGQYAAAVATYDAVLADAEAEGIAKRQAWLGKALVHLGPDKQLYSVENARTALQSAAAIQVDATTAAAIQAQYLATSLEKLAAAQAELADLNAKLAKANNDKAALAAERTRLVAEQEKLKAALEKMKQLTLGE